MDELLECISSRCALLVATPSPATRSGDLAMTKKEGEAMKSVDVPELPSGCPKSFFCDMFPTNMPSIYVRDGKNKLHVLSPNFVCKLLNSVYSKDGLRDQLREAVSLLRYATRELDGYCNVKNCRCRELRAFLQRFERKEAERCNVK